MAFTKQTASTTNISDLPNKPLISPTALKAAFDKYGADNKPFVNSLIDELEATTGTSGAENIGSKTIAGITGTTIWAQISDLFVQLYANFISKTNATPFTPTQPYHPATKKYSDDSIAGAIIGTLPLASVTAPYIATDAVETEKIKNDAVTQDKIADNAVGNAQIADDAVNLENIDATTLITRMKTGSSSYTDNDTSQTFTDAFCTTGSLVVVSITSGVPIGTWTVVAGTGNFTITSTLAESADIPFDYYIIKVVD